MVRKTALVSDDGLYRYYLTRAWGGGEVPTVAWVMLNPSTADADVDDPTIRRCMSFSDREGHRGMVVLNVYSYRATDPRSLKSAKHPLRGPEHFQWINHWLYGGTLSLVICGWGGNVSPQRSAIEAGEIKKLCSPHGIPLMCLGTTKKGLPRHPLFVSGTTPLVPMAV